MKNPLGLSILGSAVIAILCGIAGANYQPKDSSLENKASLEAVTTEEAVAAPK